MLNYSNLSDVEFEYLCQDIMEKKLGIKLRRFAAGPDGGVDIADNATAPKLLIQVKQYINSTPAQLLSSLKNEVSKVQKINPEQYYVCCAKCLSPMKVSDVYELFSDYMDSEENILTLNEIEDFLNQPENRDVLERHFKLWIESTGVLQSVLDGDIFVDSEVLIANAKEEMKLFVPTSAYDNAIKLLEAKKKKVLFIVGDPGVGKSMTSNMLALYFLAKGYRLRATSNTSDFASLKRSLSRYPDVKEIILVDDCFGQAYFDLRDHQNSDLLSLIKYVHFSKNKLMILNSRVTIFQEAKEHRRELIKAIDNKEYGLYVLDMSKISDYEKASILYNHLYASGIDDLRFAEIRKEQRYRRIISHPNYNPRIIEYVCTPKQYSSVPAKKFYSFIENNLNNPREVWKDEYENRLQLADRILLLTVFSLSDYNSDEGLVKQCFDHWIAETPSIDLTVNQFEASLRRLLDSFLRIVDEHGHRKIGVANPAVNDYLKWRIKGNASEADYILNHAYSIQQIYRLMPEEAFFEHADEIVLSGRLDHYLLPPDSMRLSFLAWRIGASKMMMQQYLLNIQQFIKNPQSLFIGGLFIDRKTILSNLLVQPMIVFYKIDELVKELDLEEIFNYGDVEDTVASINLYSPLFKGPDRGRFVECASNAIESAIEDECDQVNASDYDPDVGMAVSTAEFGEEDVDIDELYATQMIEEDVESTVKDNLKQKLRNLPQDVREDRDYLTGVSVTVYGADDLLTQYIEELVNNDDYEYEPLSHEKDEIDLMFER